MDDINGFDMSTTLSQFNQRIKELGQEAPEFIKSRNEVILWTADTTPYFEIIGYNRSDAKKLNKALKKVNNEYAILDELKLTWAKRQELSQDLQAMEEYLTKVINNPWTFRPSEQPFVPEHTADFYALLNIEPTPEQYAQASNQAGRTTNSETWVNTNNTQPETNPENNTMRDPSFTGYQEAVEKYGIKWALYHTFNFFPNMKAEQKSFWTNAAFLGWMWFLLWKWGKRLFTWGKNAKWEKVWPGFLWRLGILAGITLWTNMLTGKSPLEFIDKAINWWFKFKDIKFNFFKSSNEASPDAQTAVIDPLKATLLLGNKKISELPNMIDTNTFKLKNYDALLASTSGDNKKILEGIGKDDPNNVLLNGLAQLWITPDNLADLDPNKTIDDYYRIYCENIVTRNEYCQKNKLTIVSGKESEEKKLITSGKKITDADLDILNSAGVYEADPAVTDTAEAIKQKAELDEQIDLLTWLTTEKTEIKKEMHIFYDKMPKNILWKKEIKIIQTAGKIYLETYTGSTEIDIDKKTLTWLSDNTGKEYVFSSINEVFLAANLTNYIKKICKDKTAVAEKPFTISSPGWDIEFNDAKMFSLSFDTEIITAGWWGSLEKVSPTLEKNKQKYCDYLNTITPKIWKETLA